MTRNSWFRRGACAVVVLALLLAMVAVPGDVLGYMFCSVRPTPSGAGSPAEYAITLTALEYDNIDTLRLTFPSDSSFSMASVIPSAITVNGIQCVGGTIAKRSDGSIRLDIQLRQRLQRDQTVSILVSREAGIVNPVSPRSCYRMSVGFIRNGAELTAIESDQYAVTPSSVSRVTVGIEPAIAGAPVAIDVGFITGPNGRMVATQDYIAIRFPDDFTLPQSFTLSEVMLNGVSCFGRVFRDDKVPNGMVVYTPVDIPAGSLVNVRIPVKAGVKACFNAGPATISVHTDVEVTPVEASPVQIRGREVNGLAVQLVTVVAGAPTGVRLHFGLSAVGRLTQGQFVHVRLPVAYASPAPGQSAFAVVNGAAAATTIVAGVVDIAVPTYLPDGSSVDLEFAAGFGIVNPIAPTAYAWTVWTDSDTSPIVAMALVQAPSASGATLASSTRAIGRDASWTVTFAPSSPSTFPVAGEDITIAFDETVLVRAQSLSGSVTVNDVPAVATAQRTGVVVTVPPGIPSAGVVTVKLTEQAGIRTPAVPSSAGARVATTRDSTPVATNELVFKAMPVVTMIVTPDEPNGMSGRYIVNKPMVQLVSDNASVFYRIDGASYVHYEPGTKVTIPEGSHTLASYAVASDGTEGEPVTRSFVVDLTRPVMSLDGYSGDILVRSPQVTLTGTISEPVELVQVNGVPAMVTADNRFSVTVSVGDAQALVCYTRDVAGNVTNFVRTVHLDTVPPVITKAGSSMTSSIVHAEQYEVRVTVNEASTITVNGQPMAQSSQEFAATISLQKGMNEVTVRAVDAAGNEGVLFWSVTRADTLIIRLTADTTTAMVGDEQRFLDSPPIIVNGVTFVPLRFIGEALGAQVTWNPDLQVVSLVKGSSQIQLMVGSKLAIIDGRITQLLEAPRIQNGRTMVPLRFISEAFGADVTWDQTTKAVTVSLADAA